MDRRNWGNTGNRGIIEIEEVTEAAAVTDTTRTTHPTHITDVTGIQSSPHSTTAATAEATVIPKAPHLRFIAEHCCCAMCDTELEITHEINKSELKVKEEAYCPCCDLRVRSARYLMH